VAGEDAGAAYSILVSASADSAVGVVQRAQGFLVFDRRQSWLLGAAGGW
jgi:hypothetical protein